MVYAGMRVTHKYEIPPCYVRDVFIEKSQNLLSHAVWLREQLTYIYVYRLIGAVDNSHVFVGGCKQTGGRNI